MYKFFESQRQGCVYMKRDSHVKKLLADNTVNPSYNNSICSQSGIKMKLLLQRIMSRMIYKRPCLFSFPL